MGGVGGAGGRWARGGRPAVVYPISVYPHQYIMLLPDMIGRQYDYYWWCCRLIGVGVLGTRSSEYCTSYHDALPGS